MRRYFLYLAYDGASFHGWQVQPNARTVQGELEQALCTLLRQPISVTGAGRTDTGVHAHKMVAHIDLPEEVDAPQLVYRLNRLLSREIHIIDMRAVKSDAHARFDATLRTYHYQVTIEESPFTQRYHLYLPSTPDFEAMNEAASHLLGEHDFTTFSKVGSDVHTHLCTVTAASWQEIGHGEWRFVFSANRFLRNMVRATVGTLLDVGRGKLTPKDFLHALRARDRSLASSSAIADALFLYNVKYPEELFL
ncbi:MAG: tRNA pseudouridine(38-40) synthase TruA [Porphyromonas sp.]|nr:tRNA pseudouridine(38-40) synthase TruA [Porphyromonas sp.]